jgi:hypothetical protein
MPQCQFIFLQKGKIGSLRGGQCQNDGRYINETLCLLHKSTRTSLSRPHRLEEISRTQIRSNLVRDKTTDFPRLAQSHEVREWVDAARTATDPIQNLRASCLFCGQFLDRRTDLTIATVEDIVRFRHLVENSSSPAYYSHVPRHHFSYTSTHSAAIEGLLLCRNALLPEGSSAACSADSIAYGCHDCLGSISSGMFPRHSLANSLWTGASEVPELTGLTFIEEKVVALVHISISLFKCRIFPLMRADDFYSQPRFRGHITSYPVDPQTVATQLPLTVEKLVGIVKIIFISGRRVRFRDVCQLRFFIVRRQRVKEALEWLIRWNPLYKNVKMDGEALEGLPVDGMVPELFMESGHSSRVDLDDASHSRYDRPDGPSEEEPRSVSCEPDDSDDEEMMEPESSRCSTPGDIALASARIEPL